MNTVKWRRLSIAAAFAVAGSVLFAVIVAVSPDAAEAGRSGSDTTPPGRSDGSPTGTLPACTTSATARGTWTAARGASYPPSSGPAGTWAFVPSPSVESASPSIVVDNTLQGIEAIAPDDVWTVGYANNPDGPQYSIQTLALHWDG